MHILIGHIIQLFTGTNTKLETALTIFPDWLIVLGWSMHNCTVFHSVLGRISIRNLFSEEQIYLKGHFKNGQTRQLLVSLLDANYSPIVHSTPVTECNTALIVEEDSSSAKLSNFKQVWYLY